MRTLEKLKNLGEAEQRLMDFVWSRGPVTAEDCVTNWTGSAIKDSTVRTMLRRMESKGYIRHTVQGRTFVYEARELRESIAVRAVRQLLDRFCGGSAEELVAGMVRHKLLDRRQLERMARQIAQQAEREKGKRS